MNWRLRVVKQAIQGRLPFGTSLRRWKRNFFGYSPDASNLENTVHCLNQMELALAGVGGSYEGACILEIGSGWFPVIPLLLRMRGASQVLMTDVVAHMDRVTFDAAKEFVSRHFEGASQALSNADFEGEAFEYLAPLDLARVPDGSIDLVVSRTVLEHIQPDVLVGLLASLRPKLKANGKMVHFVDHTDHLEHTDKSISKINFLTWSDSKHRLVNLLLREGENRLRHHEYEHIFASAGFETVVSVPHVDDHTEVAARQISLAGRFREMTPEQLAVVTSVFVLAARPTASRSGL